MTAHCASQGAALPCHDDDEQLLQWMLDEGIAEARRDADYAELKRARRRRDSARTGDVEPS